MLRLRPKQAAIFEDKSRYLIAVCGRRFGKTQTAIAMVLEAISHAVDRIVYIAPTFDQAKRIFWRRLLREIPREWIAKKTESSPQTIEFTNGTILSIHGAMNYDNLRGEGYDYVIIDEAADTPYELMTEVIYPAVSDTEGRIILLGTPKGMANWLYDEYVSGAWSNHSFTTLDGGNVSEEELRTARERLDERTFNQEYLARFETATGLAYYAFSDANIGEYSYNSSAHTYSAWDFNVGVDKPLACYLLQAQHDGRIAVVKEFSFMNSNTAETSEALLSFLQQTQFSGVFEVTGDYAGNRRESSASRSDYEIIDSYFKHLRGYKRNIRPTTTIRDRVAATNALLCNTQQVRRLVVDRSCAKLINDFRRVAWKESGVGLDDRNPELTHASDAISYFAFNYFPIHKKAIESRSR